jgi:hypothetical protein
MTLARNWGPLGFSIVLLGSQLAWAADAPAGGTAAPGAPAAGTAAPGAPAAAAPTSAPTPAAPAGDNGAATPAGASSTGESSGYTVRLRSLERNVNELKEQVFQTKARLNLLKETVLGGVIGASRAVIKHKNEMGSAFRLVKATYALDGVQIFSKADDSGQLGEMKEFDIYNGAIQPGSHTLGVMLVYQGNGFGVFSYLKNYNFKAQSSQTFVAGEGKATVITVVGKEKEGLTTNLEDKPDVEFRVNLIAPEAVGTATNKK